MSPAASGEADDRDLLAEHVRGDRDAFGVLFARHRDRLWAVALRTTGNPEDAADALQDGMIAAFRRAGSYRGEAAVTTWLHRIVVNAALDRMRRSRVRAADPLPERLEDRAGPGAGSTAGPADTADPAARVVEREQRAVVLAALDTLPPDQKAALVLVDMEGFGVEEAAAVLECAPGTVKSRCSRGRRSLLALLGDLRERNPTDPPRVEPARPGTQPGPGRPGSDMGDRAGRPAGGQRSRRNQRDRGGDEP